MLESSTFLSAPDSFFASSLRVLHQAKPDAQGSATDAPVPPHNEGEWRKRQMLDVANSLEARYRTLLDTAPARAPDQPTETPPPPQTAAAPPQTTSTPALPPEHTPNHAPTTNARRSPAPVPAPTRTASPTVLRPQRALSPSLPLTEIIELDSEGEEKGSEFVKVETTSGQPLARHDTTESLKLHIKFPSRPPPPASSILSQPPASPSPSSPRARIVSGSPNPKGSTSTSSSPSRPRPKPIFKNPSAPSQYVRVPFMKRVESQEVVAPTAADDETLPISSPLSPQQAETRTLSSNSATHVILRRRHGKTAVHPKLGSPIASTSAAGATNSGSRQQAPSGHGHGHGTGRLRKRRRVELSDEDGEYPSFDTGDGNDEAVDGAAGDPKHDHGGEGEGEEGSEEEEQQHARWRESALYREAQRHAGAPSARKTHRHLGIFGQKGFPAELEHLREFAIPEWALPRGDPRVEREWEEQRQEQQAVAARSSERARRGGAGAADGAADGQRQLQDVVAAKGDEESSCTDQLLALETASALDSQMTEGSTIS